LILFPAIDLKDGQCVRLQKGEMDAATVFNDDPAAQARDFAAQGFEWLHLVDLNGAIEGRPVNAGAVEAILAASDSELTGIDGVGEARAADIREGLDRLRQVEVFDRYPQV